MCTTGTLWVLGTAFVVLGVIAATVVLVVFSKAASGILRPV